MFKGVFEAQTVVAASREEVWNYFQDPVQLEEMTQFPEVEVESSGKTESGTEIRLYLYFGIWKTVWDSVITYVDAPKAFQDQGKKLPFPFTAWKHTHTFQELGPLTGVHDYIEFESVVPAWMVKCFLSGMFKSRKAFVVKQFSPENRRSSAF